MSSENNSVEKLNQFKTETRFAWLPESVSGKIVWLKEYTLSLEKIRVTHLGCSDCHNPMSLCDKSPKEFWIPVK